MRLSFFVTFLISTACFSADDRTFDSVLNDRCKKLEAEIVRLDSLQRSIPSQFVNFQEKLEQARKDREMAATRKQGESMDDVRKRVSEANQRLTMLEADEGKYLALYDKVPEQIDRLLVRWSQVCK